MEDLIDRNNAIRTLSRFLDRFENESIKDALSVACGLIRVMPSSSMFNNCKSVLPSASGYYLVVYDNRLSEMCFEADNDEGERWGYWHARFSKDTLALIDNEYEPVGDENVTYWMPMPEFPKGRGESDEAY